MRAYSQSAATLNLLRAFAQGGYRQPAPGPPLDARLHRPQPAGRDSFQRPRRPHRRGARLHGGLRGRPRRPCRSSQRPSFYTSHEALLLPYEQALTRVDSLTGDWYDCSAHMLWIGDRTRFEGSAHVEFLRGVGNPIGMKCGPSLEPDDAAAPARHAQPGTRAGPLTLISRFGHDKVEAGLPRLVRAVKREGHPVVWSCDPMHGNVDQVGQRLQDAAVRPHPRRSAGLLRGPPRRGHPCRRHPHRDDRPGRDRVHRRRGGDHRGQLGRPLPHPLRPAPQRRQSLELAFLLAEQLKAERNGHGHRIAEAS